VPSISGNLNLTVPATAIPISQVHKGNTLNKNLSALDDRLFAAAIHKNKITGTTSLVTAHNIQVNSSGIASSSGGRNGSRWYEIGNLTGTPALLQSGTLFDSASSSPRGFWVPSVAVSGQGHMALGCSYAGSNDFAGIATAGRLRTDPLGSIQPETLAVVSSSAYNLGENPNPHRWGDYSQVTVDPNDDMTMWTFQEYCSGNNSWGVRAIQLNAPPPASPVSAFPSNLSPGASSIDITISGVSSAGAEFFDPGPDIGGPGFSNHVTATINGGGIEVNSFVFLTPTNLSLNVTVLADAVPGARTVSVTNPDGQTATSASGILTITSTQLLSNFSANPTSGTAPLNVFFTNLSSGATNYFWDFGDGNTSTATNPMNIYSSSGTYTVSLTAIGGDETNILSRTNYIVVTDAPLNVIPITGAPYLQDFDAMGPTGTTTPRGWYVGTGSGPISGTSVTPGDGSDNGGGNYNFGETASSDRALGSLVTSSTQRDTEARFINLSGSSITAFTISYTGEQWRVGGNGSVNNDLVLQYSTDGVVFTAMGPQFNFSTPLDSGSGGARDGNDPAFRVTGIGGTYTPPATITNGQTFYLRWADVDNQSLDHAMAVDDFAISFTLTSIPSDWVITPTSLDFGSTFTNTTARASFVLSNATGTAISGTATLAPGSFSILDQDSGSVSNFAFSVPGFSSTNITIAFTPLTPEQFTNTVVFVTDGDSSTNQVEGTGVTAPVFLAPVVSGTDLVFSFETITGKLYLIEYKDSLADLVWQPLEEVNGDGTLKTITISTLAAFQRFFQLRAQ